MQYVELIQSQGGWTITIVGILVVFLALYLLTIVFKLIPYFMNLNIRRILRKKGITEVPTKSLSVDTDTNAAIATALYMYFATNHDEESNIITIKRLSRRYSPWSSKIYSVTNQPEKQFRR